MRGGGFSLVWKFIAFFLLIVGPLENSFAGYFIPVWGGENGFAHMNIIITKAEIDGIPLQVGDEIGIFDKNTCVGAGILTTTITPNSFESFVHLVVSLNDGSGNGYNQGDSISYRFWDSSASKEVQVLECIYLDRISSWSKDGKFSAGATSFVELNTLTERSQTINLQAGWNLISSNVQLSNPSLDYLFKPILASDLKLKILNEQGQLFENWGEWGGWHNEIGDLAPTEGLQVFVSKDANLTFKGRPQNLPLPISLKKGWNLISFPLQSGKSIVDVFNSLIAHSALEKVQDEKGRSYEYLNSSYGWINGIGSLLPGEAYWVKTTKDAELIFDASSSKSMFMFGASDTILTTHFMPVYTGNGYNHMNIIILLNSNNMPGDELAAYDGKVCVGSVHLTENNIQDGYVSLIASAKSSGEMDGFIQGHPIQLRYWNSTTQSEEPISTAFLSATSEFQHHGSALVECKAINMGTALLRTTVQESEIHIFPNPATTFVNVDLSGIQNEISVQIQLLNMSGRTLRTYQASKFLEKIQVDDLSSGIYFIRIILKEQQIVHKLIIQ